MAAHAKLGASSAHRWLACPGSVKAERGIPDQTSSFAYEGTCAHELSELCLINKQHPDEWVGENLIENDKHVVDIDMANHVSTYVDYVNNASVGADAVFIEQRVSYADWVPEGFGTADAVILKGDRIKVCDLKYGQGVQVDADSNPQGMLYALGAYAEFGFLSDINMVDIAIIQPRLDHVSEWSISVKDLLKWAEWVSQQAEIAMSDDAPRDPGEKQCRFCKAKATCKALKNYTEAVIMADFEDLDDMPSPDTLSKTELGLVLAHKSLIEGWLSAVETEVTEALKSGEDFDGFKLVEGRSNRQWLDQEKAMKVIVRMVGKKNAYTQKLLSPAQAEKAIPKAKMATLEKHITKAAGKPTLAPESDKRPPINLRDEDFEDVSEG